MRDNLWHLKHCDLFRRLTAEQIERIEKRSRSRMFSANNPICLPAEKVDSVFLLANGLVTIGYLTADGKESVLSYIEPGEIFGELSIFDGDTQDEWVKAVEPSTVVMIPTGEMKHLMAERADVALGITKMIGLRRYRIERRLKHLLFWSNRARLVHLLLDLTEQFGWTADDGIHLRGKFSHQDLANLIGSTRETVTVILGQLKSEGSVNGGRRRIVLTNHRRLADSVNREPPREVRPVPGRVTAVAVR